MHVDALQAAARLTAVEVRAVDDVFDSVREIGIVTHVHRIAAAQFETRADEALRSCALHRVSASDRTGERDEVDARIANHSLGVLMTHVQHLKHAVRQTCVAQAFCEPLGAQRCLRGMFQDHRVARPSAPGSTLFTAMRYG